MHAAASLISNQTMCTLLIMYLLLGPIPILDHMFYGYGENVLVRIIAYNSKNDKRQVNKNLGNLK